ncbi:MAG: shikimate kinase [Flavobacteriales bacterium]
MLYQLSYGICRFEGANIQIIFRYNKEFYGNFVKIFSSTINILIAKVLKMIDRPIFLIGMMGSGKSSLASALSLELSLPLLDTDTAIEKEVGSSISEIFLQQGEASFRAKEKALIHALSLEPQIIACGGGLPCHHDLMQALLNRGVVIYLEAPVKCLFDRISDEIQRPLLASFEDFNQRLIERTAIYQKAHLTLDATLTVQQLVSECLKHFNTNLF